MAIRIGFIGLGVIGKPMAERLLDAGLPLVVWNRTAGKAQELAARGAELASTPQGVAERADVVITMLTDGPAVEGVALRADGIAAGLTPGKVHCDMSTIDLESTRRLAQLYAPRRIHFVRAPVLGSKLAAASGKLLIFAGGPSAGTEKCRPAFAALGARTWQWEQPERATCTKLACNLLLGGMMELFAEALVFAAKGGVEPQVLLEICAASPLAAPMYQAKGRTILKRDFTTNFSVRNMLKDLNLVVQTGRELGAALPVSAAVEGAFAAATAQGNPELDYSAVIEWLEQQSSARVSAADSGN